MYNNFLDMLKTRLMPFMDGDGGGGSDDQDNDGSDQGKPADPPKKTFDDILKDKDFQAEFDRRLTKGINTALENERERTKALLDTKLSEAEKLAKMTEAEKREYAAQKKEEEVRKREEAITRRELEAEAKNTLAEKHLPQALSGMLDYSNAEACTKSIATVEEAFNGAVKAGVEEKLKGGKPPKAAEHNDDELDEINKQIRNAMARPSLIK